MITKSISMFIFLVFAAIVHGNPPSRIYSGDFCKDGEFPFVVSLNIDRHHQCGGSIIKFKYILTAAHCFRNLTSEQVDNMRARSHTINSKSGGLEHRVKKIWTHPNYDPTRDDSHDDIAMVELVTPMPFDYYQNRIPLGLKATSNDELTTAVGWGYTELHPSSVSRVLKKVSLVAMDNSHCQKSLGDRVWEGQICAGGRHGEGICLGDSGGPLINANGDLIGIASYVKPCARGYPDVFTNVSHYTNWIMGVINANP